MLGVFCLLVVCTSVGAAQQAGITFLDPVRIVPPSPMYVVGVHSKRTVTIPAAAPPGSRELLMKDANGLHYRCNIPSREEGAVTTGDPDPLPDTKQIQAKLTKAIKKKLAKGCFSKTIDYWTYEVCPWRKVTQFHKEGNAIGLSFSLGKHDNTADTFNEEMQLTQTYTQGKDGRTARVTFTCNPSVSSPELDHLLTSVREPQERVYHFEILSTSACVDSEVERRRKRKSSPLELMRPMENQCVSLNTGWWTYKFCFLRDVTQAHYEPAPVPAGSVPPVALEMVTTVEYSLGRLEKFVDIEESGTLVKGATPEETYFKQTYKSGTNCDIGDKQARETEVRFYCSVHEPAVIKGVTETGACAYLLHLHTSLLCSHPAFEPKAKSTHEIVCLPVSSDAPSS